MNIGFLINQTHKEDAAFTTTILALRALQRGHSIYYIGLADLAYFGNDKIACHARVVHPEQCPSDGKTLMEMLRAQAKERVPIDILHILWLRFDPVMDMVNRPWAPSAGLQFARLAKQMGVRVLNDPDSLILADNKLYLEKFPLEVRPRTLVTRNLQDVLQFMSERLYEQIILKPLKGSGGKNVFLVTPQERHNLKQTVEVIARDGYVIVQEYLPAAQGGDIRLFLLNGEPLAVDGKMASIHRLQPKGEIRSNIHQGSEPRPAEITPEILALTAKLSDTLKQDGMYFVGIDIVGDKIMEINVFSPGGIGHASSFAGVDFASAILQDLEKDVS